MASLQLIECPRDAMQGWSRPIDTDTKIAYLDALLNVGFHSLDFGSFVSPKAIPQMADTATVLESLHWQESQTGLLAIVANSRGATEAASRPGVQYLGFPLSVSPTFQQRNTNAGMAEAMVRTAEIQEIAKESGRQMVVYLSMAFGNPYGDDYSVAMVEDLAHQCGQMGIGIISLADTVGLAKPGEVHQLAERIVSQMPGAVVGVHLHSTPQGWKEKLEAAWSAGIRRYDSALGGFGGCPMAGNDLVGNMDTNWILAFLTEKGIDHGLDMDALNTCSQLARQIFTE